MKINRKYAIRKLAVGVASVSIGLFIANSVDQDSLNVVKAVDTGYNRTESGQVNSSGGINTLKASDEVKSVSNGEKNFYSTVAFTTEAGLGSGTLINEDTIVTVAHNFVHLNTKNNPITVENNVKKSGDIHIATLPNGKQVKFSNDDVKYWNREGYVQGFKNDLAVIKLKNKFTGETGATLHNEVTKISNGDRIHVFGFPKGKLIPILNGTVENVENYGANIMGVAYQGSAPGMSGGGLYNANGELIGVNQNGVEGIRSGGITFSKEQLDWIKSIARGENANPVYLADEPKTDDKDKEEVHPKHGRLLYTDENVTGMVGKLYEDGTYVMKSDGKGNMLLDNSNQGFNSMFYGLTDKDGKPLSAEEVDAIKYKVKRIEVEGKIVADKLATDVSNNTTELDLTGVTLSDTAEQAPFLAYYADNLTKLTLDPNLSLSKVKNGNRIIDNAPNLKLTNEQVTQLLKDTKFENSDGIFNNVGIERLDLTSFDNFKLNNNGVLFKNLKGLKEIAFGNKFYDAKYIPMGQSNSYFDTDLSTVEKVSGTTNSVFIKEWVKAVKDANIPKKEAVYKDGIRIGTLEEILNKNDFENGVYTIGEDNPEVDMHLYYEYSIQDGDEQIEYEFRGNKSFEYKGKIIKTEEVFPESGKWHANDTVWTAHRYPKEDFRLEYNNDVYKVWGSSEVNLVAGSDNNDLYKEQYDRAVKFWHQGDYLGLFYPGLEKAANGKVFKQVFYLSPVRGSYTQLFIDEDQAKAHENDENYNPEDYSIKDKYFSDYHKLTEDLVVPKVPKYIQKDNKIYKLSSQGEEPTTKKYIDAELFTEYKYKVVHENTTKEDITRVAPKDVYVADESRDRTSENIKTNGTEGITRTVTTYKVDNGGNLTEETTTPEKTEVVNNIIKVGTKPKVEYIGRGKDIIRKTTTYTVNSETGVVSENVKEEVNPEVDMHFYFVYSIKDSDTFIPSSPDEIESPTSNYKGKVIKEVEYIPEKGKWLANDTLHSFSDDNSDNDIVGAVKWPDDEKFEYNNDIYKVVGSSVEHIISGPDSNDTERRNYEEDSKIWHRFPNSRLFYRPGQPVGNEDYNKLDNLGLAKDGTIVKAFLYAEPVRGSYTQTFIDEDQAKAHENDEDYNPENYFIKDRYDSGKHKLTEDFVLPKAPQHIQKDNKIYKLSSHDTEPTINKYIDADLSTEYRYKVLHDNTTKEEITRVEPKDVYVADESRDRTSENVKTNGTEGITRTITTYKVDNDGNLTEEVSTPEKTEVVNNVIKVGTKPKVEYFIRDDVAMKKTTTYTVNSETGEVTEKVQENVIGRAKAKVKTTPIPSPRVYQKDSERDLNMPNEVIQGEEGLSLVNITYTLNKETGELTENQSEPTVKNPTPTIIKVAAKDKVVYSKKGNDIIKTTTTYNVNENNGEITSNTKEEVFKVDGLKDKVVVEDIEIPTVYLKDGNREKGKPNMIVEGELGKKTTTTTYNVNPKTGEVFEEKISTDIKHPKDKRIYVPAKDKIEVETIPYTTTYEKDGNRELGKANLIYEGAEGSKTTIIKYKVNEKTGEITEERGKTLIREAQGKRILVPAKDKVEVVNKKDGKIIKKTTVYNVNPNTGKITEDIKEEVIADKGDSTTEENLTELKVDLQKDTDGNILNVIKMGETPKDLPGYINTGKTEITKEGYKVYIYQKVETSKGEELPPVVENKEFSGGVNPDNAPVVENLPELKVALIKDTENNILDVVEENGKPVEIKDYVFTGKQEVDKDGYKVYIYQKVESSKGIENPPVVENKEFTGGVNPTDAPVVEELPELKVAVIKDNKDNILDVIKAEEKPKDIPGYKNTGKTGIDKDGYKTYIYEKVKEDKQSVVEDKKEANLKENNNKEIAKKEELPSTTAIPMLSSVSLLSVLGVRKRKSKK